MMSGIIADTNNAWIDFRSLAQSLLYYQMSKTIDKGTA